MKIAVLAWGSLFWDKKELKIIEDWKRGGVNLPIEFARISSDGRLTLVITEEYGTCIETYWALSKFSTLNEAINNLQVREGTNKNGIGFVNLIDGKNQSKFSKTLIDRISNWAKEKSLDAVIWTDLKSNFSEKQGEEFSFENAEKYLLALNEEKKVKADEYIKKAPDLTMTKLRKRINESYA
jgi:hypothetical protein